MSGTTGRLALPMLEPGQAQKEATHNEALATLDLATQASVMAVGVDAPPAAPLVGQSWIVGAAPSGAWAEHANALAGWTAGGWRFVAPFEGLSAWSVADGSLARFDGAVWRIAARGAAIADPAGGSVTDAEARAGVAAILAALRAHGVIAGD